MGAVKKLKKPYVHSRHLVDLEVVETASTIHNPDGTSYTVEPGDVLSVNEFGEKNLVPENHLPYYFEVEKLADTNFYDRMAKGYEDMGQINLEEANVGHNATNRAEMLTVQLLAGKNNL